MVRASESRYAARRVSPTEWTVHDLCYPDDDRRQMVCSARSIGETAVEVHWHRDLPLPLVHDSLDDLLELLRGLPDECRATRPIPISHRPPPT